MKTNLFGLFFLGLTSLSFAQNDLAVLNTNDMNFTNEKSKKILSKNLDYKTTFYNQDIAKHILKFQNIVATYNVKNAAIYDENSSGTYIVIFEEGENKITANYDKDGKIIACNEVYNDIKLPFKYGSEIVKEYPGWEIKAVTCYIKYYQDKNEISYQVKLKKGNKTKRLQVRA
jgi:hypothetical protein